MLHKMAKGAYVYYAINCIRSIQWQAPLCHTLSFDSFLIINGLSVTIENPKIVRNLVEAATRRNSILAVLSEMHSSLAMLVTVSKPFCAMQKRVSG